jgi:predicted nucleic acid-binding protein
MDVFDSNVWIYGLVGDCEEAVALLEEVLTDPIHVAVNAYIFDEVMQNLARADLAQDVIDSAQTEFATIVHGSHTVHGPTQDELRQMDVEAHRLDPRVEMIGETFGIQPKDVPILVFAHQYAQQPDAPTTVIHTADREFARFDPSDHFESIVMRYVNCLSEP